MYVHMYHFDVGVCCGKGASERTRARGKLSRYRYIYITRYFHPYYVSHVRGTPYNRHNYI